MTSEIKSFLLKYGWTFTEDCYYINPRVKSTLDKGEEWKDRKLTEREAYFYELGFCHGRELPPVNLRKHNLN